MDEGHCGLPTDQLIPLAEELVEAPKELILTALELERSDGAVIADRVGDTACTFLAGLYRAERAIAERLIRIANGKLPWAWIDEEKAVPWVESRSGLQLADSQKAANRRLWVRLHEKGGKRHEMPCHHNLEAYLHAYIDGCGLSSDFKGPLFRTIGRGTDKLTATRLPQANAYAMIRRRALAADIKTKIGNHTFRATGITAYLKNGGTLEKAAAMANHASTRTTQLYDRRRDEVNLDEVERILI
jgi:Phage integrase family